MRTVDWRTLWEEHAEPGELRRVLCALSVSMGGNGGQAPTNCSPSMQRIARRAGMRTDTASRWIKTAEAEGWVNVGRVTGLRNRYYATVPKPLAGLVAEDGTVASKHAHKPGKAVRGEGGRIVKRAKADQTEHPCPVCGGLVGTADRHPDDGSRSPGRAWWKCGTCSWWSEKGFAPWEDAA